MLGLFEAGLEVVGDVLVWGAEWQVRAAVLVSLVCGSVSLIRLVSPVHRSVVWSSVLVALFVMPLVGSHLPALRFLPDWSSPKPTMQDVPRSLSPLRVEPTGEAMPNTRENEMASETFRQSESVFASTPIRVQREMDRDNPVSRLPAWSWVGLLWLGGSCFFVGRLFLGGLRFQQFRSQAFAVSEGPLYECFLRALRDQVIERPVDLVLTPYATLPMTGGVLRSTIFLPEGAEQWSRSRIQSVLAHELGHVKRWDSLFLLVIQCLAVFYWFNPLFWLLVRRWGSDCELVCDERAISSGVAPKVYAETLLELCTSVRGRALPAVLCVGNGALPVKERIERVLQFDSETTPIRLWKAVLMCVGVLGVAAGVGALQLKDKRLEVEDFSDSVASWIAESVRAEYPNLAESAEARMKSDFSAFLHEICVTNALARDWRKELLDSIPHFLPDYVYRGGAEVDGRAASRMDQFGRRRADMRLEDDLLSLKWALWRALTKPQLNLSEKEQLSQQRKFLVEYFEARDALFSTLKDLEYLMGTLTHQSRLEHLSWFRLRERLLLERSFRDPLDSVFDLPLPPEKFTEVMLRLQRVLERARTEDDPMAIFQLPSVRQVAWMIKYARYTPSPLVSEFFLPFDSEKKVINLDGPRSWDDPIHLRMMFLSHHPEATTHYDSQMRFSVAPIVRKNLRLGISGGIAPWDEGSNSADYMLNSLMGPVSERPIFFHRGYGQSRDLLRELSFRVPLTYDEEKRLRALMRDPMIDSLDSLLASAMSNPDPKSRRAVDKVRAVHAWQHAVIAKYEKALALDWLSESDEAELGRLLVGLRNRSVDWIFSPRDRFQGFVARDAKTQTGILYARYHSNEPFSGTYDPNRVRTPEIYLGTLGFTGLDSFKILIQGELTPALIGRFESGDDQALVLRIAESGDAVDSGTAIQFRRDEAIRFTFSEREYEFTYVSTWGRLTDSATAAPEVVFLRLAYFPQASE